MFNFNTQQVKKVRCLRSQIYDSMSFTNDVAFIVGVCAYLGIVPFFNKKQGRFAVSLVYNSVVPIAMEAGIAWNIVAKMLENVSENEALLNMFVTLLTIKFIYVACTFAATILKCKSFNYFLQTLGQFDTIVSSVRVGPEHSAYFKYFLFALLLLLECCYTSYVFRNEPISIIVPNLTIVWNSHGTLLRYLLLDLILQRTRLLEEVICKKSHINDEMQVSIQAYTVICDSVNLFNDMFKWLVFLDFIIMYVNIIDEIRYALLIGSNLLESAKGWSAIVKCTYIMLLQLMFIIKCEQLRSTLEEIASHANRIAAVMVTESKSSLMVMLVCRLGGKQPSITAGGVFTMGYPEVFAFFNLAVTYVIVVITLNGCH